MDEWKLPPQPTPPYEKARDGRNMVPLGAAMAHAERYAQVCVRLALAEQASKTALSVSTSDGAQKQAKQGGLAVQQEPKNV